ncbi:sigma-54-dependent transcriptional regulator [Paraburkholderia hayleyella]|uniref:sigma-54-dependent transcriptional regulator n=1 Tax=Paraburkholderia hayleyella TaxID=2152889 RepID=UPI0012929873|nr:sigma-54 dependent transcriptional regulator [Paraburkholderia hayleyella]
MPHALIVEDDPNSLSGLAALLTADDFSVAVAATLTEARVAIARFVPDVVLVDLNLPDGSGLDLLHSLPASQPDQAVPVIVMTGHATVESAIEGLRHGIWDYLLKPVNIPRLRSLLARIPRPHELGEEVHALRLALRRLGHFGPLLGKSSAMQQVYDALEHIASTEAAVMLCGEAGSGKKLTARTLHQMSRRRTGPFVVADCRHIAATLHATGQTDIMTWFGETPNDASPQEPREPGFFEQARGGTLLLDGMTALPLAQQTALIEALKLQERLRSRGAHDAGTDFRLVLALSQTPANAVAQGTLHPELVSHLDTTTITLAPLRERGHDPALLAYALLDELNHTARAHGTAHTTKLASANFIQECLAHEWPGNVSELQERIRTAFFASGEVLESLSTSATSQSDAYALQSSSVRVNVGTALSEVEDMLIRATLEAVGGTRHRAASLLGISPKTLYNKLQRMQA